MLSEPHLHRTLLLVDDLVSEARRYALYGTGNVARQLLDAIRQCHLPAPAILLDDRSAATALDHIPIHTPTPTALDGIHCVLLGSDSFQQAMRDQLARQGLSAIPAINLAGGPYPSPPPALTPVPNVNIYHCCAHKTASQWIRRIFSDPQVIRQTGLTPHTYEDSLPGGVDPRPILERRFPTPFPPGTVVTPLYTARDGYLAIPKPAAYKAFYVLRDPRDILVSLYFSNLYSHPAVGEMSRTRQRLESLSLPDGLASLIRQWQETGYFSCLRSWVNAGRQDPNLLVTRYEELTGRSQPLAFRRLFAHCAVPMSPDLLVQLLDRNSFQKLAGRKAGQEDVRSHFRKGVAGDWKNYFDRKNLDMLYSLTGDLLDQLGYER